MYISVPVYNSLKCDVQFEMEKKVIKKIISFHRYEGALDPWMQSLWRRLHQISPSLFPQGPDFVIPDMKFIDRPKVHITYHNIGNGDSKLSLSSSK